jgi:signal transduction histidine kinase
VLLNLVGNAVRVTVRGGVTVRVRADGDDAIAWEVADTGPGLTPGLQARLWAAWERLEGMPGRDEGGAGLGLGLARELALAMGGSLDVASVHGAGSTFTLRLPVRPPAARLNPPAASADTRS